jgi:hypothetical protein
MLTLLVRNTSVLTSALECRYSQHQCSHEVASLFDLSQDLLTGFDESGFGSDKPLIPARARLASQLLTWLRVVSRRTAVRH